MTELPQILIGNLGVPRECYWLEIPLLLGKIKSVIYDLTPGGDGYVFIFADHSDEVVILDLDVLAKETKIS